ncbi:hypothetical protein G4228_016571, partial [Cervus hanglu yarkandensis]
RRCGAPLRSRGGTQAGSGKRSPVRFPRLPAEPRARRAMARRPRHSIYSSDEDDEDIEMCDHDYDGLLPKSGKRHLGKTRWTREEDEKLKKLVEQNGTDDWKVIANYLPNRTDVQCQHRWQKVLNPELIKGPWTKEEDQRVSSHVPYPVALHVNIVNVPQPAAAAIQRHYNDEDPEKEKRIKELELLLMSTENELKGQQALPTQNHTCNYTGWHSTTIGDHTRPHGDSAPVSCLEEHHSTPSLPADPGSLPEESASPARCMIVHQGTILDNVKNLLEFAETLQFIDSFLNTSNNHENLDLEMPSLTSTPLNGHKLTVTTPFHRDQTVKIQKENTIFRTPAIKRSILESSPRTPTPFKHALTAQEIKYGPLKMLPQTPSHLVEDLQDVIKQESDESVIVAEFQENGQPLLKKIKQEVESPTDKAGNFFCSNHWEGESLSTQLFTQASPVADVPNILTSSVLMTPVSEDEDNVLKAFTVPKNRSLASPLQPCSGAWESASCGKTDDQMTASGQPRKYVNAFSTRTLVM